MYMQTHTQTTSTTAEQEVVGISRKYHKMVAKAFFFSFFKKLNNKMRTNQRCLYKVVFHSPPSLSSLPSSFLPLVLSKHADQVRCGISKSKNPLNINTACVCFFFLIFLLSFDSFLFCLETYWDACIAKQSCDELLIDDSFIKAPCCTRTWHFLTLNLQRTDTNALMSFKLVYKLGRVGGPLALKNWRPGSDRPGLKASTSAKEKVRLCVWLCLGLHEGTYTRL